MRRIAPVVALFACGGPAVPDAGAAPSAPPEVPASDGVLPAPERPVPFALPRGASTLSSSSLDGTRSVALAVPGDEEAATAWVRSTLQGLGCREIDAARPWEELELRCRDRAGTSAVVARVGDRITVVVTWFDLPDRIDVGE